jgi:hypothetical protein
MDTNKAYSITAEECAKIAHEEEICKMIYYLRKAIIEVGDMKMQDAVDKLLTMTRFANELAEPGYRYIREQ